MPRTYIRSLAILALMFAGAILPQAEAQNFDAPPAPAIKLLARSYADSIVLRWAPDDAAAWSVANRYGYQVIRTYIGKDSLPHSEILNQAPLMPMTLEQMKAAFGAGDTLAAIAAQALYGKAMQAIPDPAPKSNPSGGIMKEHEMQQNRYAFALQAAEFSPPVAKALGLRFTDKNVKAGMVYDYTVKSLVPAEIVRILPGTAILQNLPATALIPPAGLDIRQSAPYRIELIWQRDMYTAYYIERSTDEGKTFIRLNHRPWFSTLPETGTPGLTGDAAMYNALLKDYHIFIDSVIPGNTYHYRVSGYTSFGETSPHSQSISIRPVDLLFPPAPALDPIEKSGNLSTLRWQYPASASDLKGFVVQKSANPDGPWQNVHESVLNKEIRRYTDPQANATSVYYRVLAEDQAGNRSPSFAARCIIEDSIAPAIPRNLQGIVYREGIVELFWDAVSDKDIKGYRVLYANQDDHQYTVLTPKPVKDTYFRDSINLHTLTQHIFYKVLAEDQSGNISETSKSIRLRRPDLVPPAKVVVLESSQDAETVTIRWSLSASDDVSDYQVYRKTVKETDWQLLKTLKAASVKEFIVFSDTPSASKDMIQYSVMAVDSAGNTSGLSRPLAFRVKGKPVENIPLSLQAVYNKSKNAVDLSWNGEAGEAFYYQLLRSAGTEEPVVYKSLESGQKSFSDTQIQAGTKYNYAIRIAFKDGRKSGLSKGVSVVVK